MYEARDSLEQSHQKLKLISATYDFLEMKNAPILQDGSIDVS